MCKHVTISSVLGHLGIELPAAADVADVVVAVVVVVVIQTAAINNICAHNNEAINEQIYLNK